MKKYFVFLFIFFIITSLLFSQVNNFQYSRTIDRCINYDESEIIKHNDRVFLFSDSNILEYFVNDSGEVELYNNYFKESGTSNLFIFGDTLISVNKYNFQKNSNIITYDISGNNFNEIAEYDIFHNNLFTLCSINNNYFFYKLLSQNSNVVTVLKRGSFQPVTQIESFASYYEVNDNYIFEILHNQNGEYYLKISDISDIYNPIQLSLTNLGNSPYVRDMAFNGNKIFLLSDSNFLIIDINNINQPTILTEINIPDIVQPSWMSGLYIEDNNLIIYNSLSQIWIYNLNDINNPTLLIKDDNFQTISYTGGNIFRHALVDNRILFLANNNFKFSSLNLENLPNIELLDSAGFNPGFFLPITTKFNNFILYPYTIFGFNSPIYINYFDINQQTFEIKTLQEGAIHFINNINDSLLCLKWYDNLTQEPYIKFYKILNDSLVVYNQMIYDNSAYQWALINNKLLYFYNDGTIKFFSTDMNNFSEYLGEINLNTNTYELVNNYKIYDNYLFFTYNYDYQKRLKIFENEPPFNELYDFEIGFSDNNFQILFLNEHLLLKQFSDGLKKLYFYNFPDTMEESDTLDDSLFIDYSLITGFTDSLIFESNKNQNGTIDEHNFTFIPITNGQFGNPYYYDFQTSTCSIYFIPNTHKFYALGRYFIQEYSYQLTGSEDDYITPVSKPIMLNYPNPFNPSTTISFTSQKAIKDTKIEIYNLKGEKIREINVDNCKSGENKIVWDGKDNQGKKVAAGVYLYSLKQNGKRKSTKKMIMIK